MGKYKFLQEIELLYIEDDVDMSSVMQEILSPNVKKLFVAYDGKEGLKYYKDKKPDLILTDVRMPKLDGLDMAKLIRDEDKDIPIIINSAFSDVDMFIKAIHIGISDYILKPSSLHNILEKLDSFAKQLFDKKAYKESKIYFQSLLDAQPHIVVINEDKKLVDANKAFLEFFNHYKTIEEFLQTHNCICDMFEESDEDDFIFLKKDGEDWLELIKDESKQHKCVISKDGKKHIFLIYLTQVTLHNKLKNILTFVDITQIYEAQQELLKKEEILLAQSRTAAMGEMLSMIAHQWRQPLTIISMASNNLLADIDFETLSSDEVKKQSKEIVAQVQHLSKTIDDFRDFFKPDKQKEVVKISKVIDDTLQLVSKSFEHNDIQYKCNYYDDSEINIYQRELLQVFLNILNNARDALVESQKDQKLITITLKNEGDYIVIKICNNGGTIKEENLYRIFEPYFSTKKEKNGTGLGLYMSKNIVQNHLNGILEVENRDEGVCFFIKLKNK